MLWLARDEKLRARVKSRPSDLKWDELARFLAALGYEEKKGSRFAPEVSR
jgi:hypothetical protein